ELGELRARTAVARDEGILGPFERGVGVGEHALATAVESRVACGADGERVVVEMAQEQLRAGGAKAAHELDEDGGAGGVELVHATKVEDYERRIVADVGLDLARQLLGGAEEDRTLQLEDHDAVAGLGEELGELRLEHALGADRVAAVRAPHDRAAHS